MNKLSASLKCKVNNNEESGFTLVELLITIAIIGILSAVAYPVYTEQVKKGQRADGLDSLLFLSSRMEEFYMTNDTYAGATVATLLGKTVSDEGYYNLTIDSQTAFNYKITATRKVAADDPQCTSLSLDQLGNKTATGSATDMCW